MSRRESAAFVALTILLWLHPRGSEVVRASGSCAVAVGAADGAQSGDRTQEFLSYLLELIERGTIGSQELKGFLKELENGTPVNPLPLSLAEKSHRALIQRQGLADLLESGAINSEKVEKEVSRIVREMERVTSVREETKGKTEEVFVKMETHPVKMGPISIRYKSRDDKKVLLNYSLRGSLEVMTTPVTQMHWVIVMGENPAHFASGPDSTSVGVHGRSVVLQPDYPIENISWWSAIEFANRISAKMGLEPAYNLNGVVWKRGTRAENGTLSALSGTVRINQNPNAGYRLPYQNEYLYLASLAGALADGRSIVQVREFSNLFSCNGDNSEGSTRSVLDKLPLIIDGKSFQDLFGNVYEWGNNQPWRDVQDRLIFGGSWDTPSDFFRPENLVKAEAQDPNVRQDKIGFRLVRTIHE